MKLRFQINTRQNAVLGAAAFAVAVAAVFAFPSMSAAQTRNQDRSPRAEQSAPRKPPQNADAHARREVVRDRAPIPMPQRQDRAPQRPAITPQSPPVTPQRPSITPQSPPVTPQRQERTPVRQDVTPQRPDRTQQGQDATRQPTDRTPYRQGATVRNPIRPNGNGLPGVDSSRAFRGPQTESPQRVLAHRSFTRTQEGRRYDNGIHLRRGIPVHDEWQRPYFPRGAIHFPYYVPSYRSGYAAISPFGFFFGVCAPYISRQHCYHAPPPSVYVDIPLYSSDVCRGYAPIAPDDNYVDRNYLLDREPGLANAVDEIREAFRSGNIDSLVALTDPNIKIAVFLKGRYDYSLDTNDYLDMTRDALLSMETISFDITRIHERAAGVYVVSGEHVYKTRDGNVRKVYVSFVLEDIRSVWTLTQVGTAPDRIQEWK